MARAQVIVEKWVCAIGYPNSDEDLALLRAHLTESVGVPARVYRRTPEGPQVIYESPKS